MNIAAIVVSIFAFCISVFTLLINLGIIKVVKPINDKYSKYRNEDGLYSAKKVNRRDDN